MLPIVFIVLAVFSFIVLSVALLASILGSLAALLAWIVQSIARMKMAKKMNVKHGWFAFLPLFSHYLSGKMAEASVAKRCPEKRPFRWGAFIVFFTVVNFVVTMVVQIPSLILNIKDLFVQVFNILIQSPDFVDLIPVDLIDMINAVLAATAVLDFLGTGILGVVGFLLGIVGTVVSFLLLVFVCMIRYKVMAGLAPTHATWMFIVELVCEQVIGIPASLIFDILLGFTNLLAPKKKKDEIEAEIVSEAVSE